MGHHLDQSEEAVVYDDIIPIFLPLICPSCGRRGVFWKERTDNESNWYCRFGYLGCDWFTWSTLDRFTNDEDRKNLEALWKLNDLE